MNIRDLYKEIEKLHAKAQAERKATDDFEYKNIIASREVAYEQVMHLIRKNMF